MYGAYGVCCVCCVCCICGSLFCASVTCAPQSYYDEWIDLKPFDGAICDKVAYSDVYTDR